MVTASTKRSVVVGPSAPAKTRAQFDEHSYDAMMMTDRIVPINKTPENFEPARGLAYAPYADMLWCETSTPDMAEAQQFADAIHAKFPDKLLAHNCSPSFHWKKKLDDSAIANFQKELGKMGYKFQFVTLAGFHALNMSMFHLARGYAESGMSAYSKLQQGEFAAQELGYKAVKHQAFVGTGYFDEIARVVSSGNSSITALAGSTETAQFHGQEDSITSPAVPVA